MKCAVHNIPEHADKPFYNGMCELCGCASLDSLNELSYSKGTAFNRTGVHNYLPYKSEKPAVQVLGDQTLDLRQAHFT